MELVTVRTYLQFRSTPKKFAAEYVRANGERTMITTGEWASIIAKEKATIAVQECEWEPLNPSRKDGFIDVGHGWMED